MTPYAEALEQQIALAQWCDSPQAWTLAEENARHSASLARGPASAREIRATWLTALEEAVPFFWSAPMCTLLTVAAPQLSGFALRAEDLPVPAGFCWFAKPLALPTWRGQEQPMAAFSWWRWFETDSVSFVVYDKEPGWTLPTPVSILVWSFGESPESLIAKALTQSPASDVLRFEAKVQAVAAALALVGQNLATSAAQQVDRAARRRVERQGWTHDPVVRVVELRRRVTEARADNEHEDVEWSCRWLVRGHWRQQWCPAAREHRPIWITPYVKGPEDKPLKPPRATIFAVVR